jgi:hypothetical protein
MLISVHSNDSGVRDWRRIMNMHNQGIADSTNRRSLIRRSDARAIMGDDEDVLLRMWRGKRGESELEDLSSELHPPCDRASAKPSVSLVRAAHAEFVAALAGHPPRPIPLEADAPDLEDRADHLNTVLSELTVYLTVILDDTAQNVLGSLDLRDAEGVLADLLSDLTGAIQHAADDMAGRVE